MNVWPGVAYTGLVADGRPAHVLISLYHHLEKHLPHIVDVMDAARTRFPNIRFVILASAEEEEKSGALARHRYLSVQPQLLSGRAIDLSRIQCAETL